MRVQQHIYDTGQRLIASTEKGDKKGEWWMRESSNSDVRVIVIDLTSKCYSFCVGKWHANFFFGISLNIKLHTSFKLTSTLFHNILLYIIILGIFFRTILYYWHMTVFYLIIVESKGDCHLIAILVKPVSLFVIELSKILFLGFRWRPKDGWGRDNIWYLLSGCCVVKHGSYVCSCKLFEFWMFNPLLIAKGHVQCLLCRLVWRRVQCW